MFADIIYLVSNYDIRVYTSLNSSDKQMTIICSLPNDDNLFTLRQIEHKL